MASKRQHHSSFIWNRHNKTVRKRFKRDSTLLERLPNELLIEIFSYLPDVDIVYAFSQLNNRFQCLIHDCCDTFDFKSVSKSKFKLVIREHDTTRWQSLRLSDDDDTPGQVTVFSNLFPFAKCVPQLKALSLVDMKPRIAQILIPQLKTFAHLVSLTIGTVCGKTIPSLELPLLKHLVVSTCKSSKWMKNFSQLESLEHTIEHVCSHENNLVWPTKLKRLKVFFKQLGDSEIVRASLSHLSQLNSLAVYDTAWESPPPDGQKWETIIVSSLPLLKNFQFFFKFWRDSGLISDINRIVATFSTPFYLEEKRWLIRCDAHYQQFSVAVLYSLPFAFSRFEVVTDSFEKSISTSSTCCKSDSIKNSYGKINTLVVDVKCEKLDQTFIIENVKYLTLKYSVTSFNWLFSMIRLRQLSLGSQIDMLPRDFARFLKNTPYLNSLIVSYNLLNLLTNHWKSKIVCEQLSYKIRSLKLYSDDHLPSNIQDYVKVDELLHIVDVFGKRCQNLTVSVYSRNLVAGLILRSMRRLRSLKVCLKEHDDMKITKEWLKEQDITLKNLDCSIAMDGNEYSFWFDNRR